MLGRKTSACIISSHFERGVPFLIPVDLYYAHSFTESHNHRIVGIGRDLCGAL